MTRHLLIFFVLIAGIVAFLLKRFQPANPDSSVPWLHVAAPSSWVSPEGVSITLSKNFEAFCRCRIHWHELGDALEGLRRLREAPSRPTWDVVLGLNDLEVSQWQEFFLWDQWTPDEVPLTIDPIQQAFIPVGWSVFGLIVTPEVQEQLDHLKQLTESSWRNRFVILDPLHSSTGAYFWAWLVQQLEPEPAVKLMKALMNQTDHILASWQSAFQLWLQGRVQIIPGYLSSLAYPQEKTPTTMTFWMRPEVVYPIYVEYGVIVKNSPQKTLARQFINFLLTPEGQKILMHHNYMLPVRENVKPLPVYQNLPKPLKTRSLQVNAHDVFTLWKQVWP